MNLKWPWPRKKTELRVRLVDCPVTHLRADEFRADKELVHLAAGVLANPNMQIMLQVLKNEHPGHEVLISAASLNDRIVRQAMAEGYEICLSTLESLGKEQSLPARLQSTFGAEPENNYGR